MNLRFGKDERPQQRVAGTETTRRWRLTAIACLVALPLAAWCVPCRADSTIALRATAPNAEPTTITLQPSERAGAVAEIVLHNQNVNSGLDEISTDLTLGALTVNVRFDWEADAGGADAVIATPPEGVVCMPTDCRLVVPEDGDGVLYLFSGEDVGM